VISPPAADAIRKVVGYTLAVVLTVLLFRVLGRTANGRQTLTDVDLVALAALTTVAILWVRAAKRVRRGAPPPGPDDPPIL